MKTNTLKNSGMEKKKILIGVSGSIAAYKTAYLIRHFIKAGSEVKVVMTPSSTEFITPLTLSVLSKNPVLIDFADLKTGKWNNHVELGRWSDAIVIAPCSANTLAKLVHGLCDNLLCAVVLSSRCPVYIAPAMDVDMYNFPPVQKNIETLKDEPRFKIIPPEEGELASGLTGEGRMAEPETIFNIVSRTVEQWNS